MRNWFRSSAVSIMLVSGSRPTGMYRKCHARSAPLAMSGSTNSSLTMAFHVSRVTVHE